MMQVNEIEWSEAEKEVAKAAFDIAYKREINALIDEVRKQSSEIVEIDDIWRLHDFLSARRHNIDGKYDYEYSGLIFVFASLVKDGWLHLNELDGLNTNKLTKIAAIARI
ncbi:MAG: hypothetical protein I4E98_06515 [Planktothrix agardhii KL2]|jgi:hypothetical protein|uniref:hypothetical protein n=1 Tax=Planktothrix agardhii TaxID=1160 RepID=UPI001A1B1D02|nr:hypothetical protein [Planktothrix agardhii]MBG0746229.1 hypothetical protein [Planktothrix agardhii KL2]MDS1344381.1 hypothetical protein [Planktothrix agardhii NRERC-751]